MCIDDIHSLFSGTTHVAYLLQHMVYSIYIGCDRHLVYLAIIGIQSYFMPKMSAKGIVNSDSRPKSLVKGGIRQGLSSIDFFRHKRGEFG